VGGCEMDLKTNALFACLYTVLLANE